jgi:hypothetical protein
LIINVNTSSYLNQPLLKKSVQIILQGEFKSDEWSRKDSSSAGKKVFEAAVFSRGKRE